MSFHDLKNQSAVADQLRRALQRGRLGHAYLLVGPRGSGKQVVARTLAKALNCENAEHDSCDSCDSCRRIDEGYHPDVYWVRPESKSRRILVEQIRDFEKSVNLKPTMAHVKVGIIEDADCMGESASNAFLKTLEEPPAQTVILLLTSQPDRLLPTILSRCLRLALGPLEESRAGALYTGKLVPLLVRHAQEKDAPVVAAYRLLAGMQALLNEMREETRQRIEKETNLDQYEEIDAKTMERLDALMQARIEGECRGQRERVVEELYTWFADLALCANGLEAGMVHHAKHLRELKEASRKLTPEQAAANLDAIEDIGEMLSRNVNETTALEAGLLKLG